VAGYKQQAKVIDPARPVVRALTTSPERSRAALDKPRPGSSRASLGAGQVPTPSNPLSLSTPVTGCSPVISAVRRRQLPNVALLPSKFSSK